MTHPWFIRNIRIYTVCTAHIYVDGNPIHGLGQPYKSATVWPMQDEAYVLWACFLTTVSRQH